MKAANEHKSKPHYPEANRRRTVTDFAQKSSNQKQAFLTILRRGALLYKNHPPREWLLSYWFFTLAAFLCTFLDVSFQYFHWSDVIQNRYIGVYMQKSSNPVTTYQTAKTGN